MSYDEAAYWEARYRSGGDSGVAATADETVFKADAVAAAARAFEATSILDFGMGDGRVANLVLGLIPGQVRYHGLDISSTAIARLAAHFSTRHETSFAVADLTAPLALEADVVLCLDVLFHASTEERALRILENVLRCARRGAVVCTWNERVLERYPRLAEHCFYRPFQVPDGMTLISSRIVGPNDCKTIYVLASAGARRHAPDPPDPNATVGGDGRDAGAKRTWHARFSASVEAFRESACRTFRWLPYVPGRDSLAPTFFAGLYRPGDFGALEDHAGPAVVYLCGSDALGLAPEHVHMLNALPRPRMKLMASPALRVTLERAGVRMDGYHPVFLGDAETFELTPAGGSVYCYVPQERRDFYGIDHVARVAARFPELRFYLARWGDHAVPFSNAVALPAWLPRHALLEVYRACFCGIRPIIHDGFSSSVVELALMGRPSISFVDYGLSWVRHARTTEELIDFVRDRVGKGVDARLAARAKAHVFDDSFLEIDPGE